MEGSARLRQTGFTLIELAVVMVIIVILAAAALPAYRDFNERYRLRSAVEEVTSVIASARAAAVKADRNVNVKFGGTVGAWCVGAKAAAEPTGGNPAAAAGACNCANDASQCVAGGQPMVVATGAHPGITMAKLPSEFVFDSKLGVVQSAGTSCAEMSSPHSIYTMRISVNALGQTTACATGKGMVGARLCSDLGVAACP